MNVFISYASQDRRLADELRERLSAEGIRAWDPERDLFPGDNRALKTGEALRDADALVVLLTPAALASNWVRSEVVFATASRTFAGRLVPVVSRGVRAEHVSPVLARLASLTLEAESQAGWAGTLDALRRIRAAA